MKPTSSKCWSSRRSMVFEGERVAVFTASDFTLRLQVERQKRQHLPHDLARDVRVFVALEPVLARGVIDQRERQISSKAACDNDVERSVQTRSLIVSRTDEQERHVRGHIVDGLAVT